MELKTSKTKINKMIQFLSRVEDISECAVFVGDVINPMFRSKGNGILPTLTIGNESDVNGRHILQNNCIDLPLDSTKPFLFQGVPKALKEHIKETGITHITINITEYDYGVMLDQAYYNLLTRIDATKYADCVYGNGTHINYAEYVNDTILHHPGLIDVGESHPHQILKIINGGVVELTDRNKTTLVRVSKNLFPLTGSIRMTDDRAFSYKYALLKSSHGSNIIALIVDYKSINAIHLYYYVDFINSED